MFPLYNDSYVYWVEETNVSWENHIYPLQVIDKSYYICAMILQQSW
jgi:hypothetical protein